MASTSHSSSFSSHESIRVLVKSINQHLTELLSDPKTRKDLNSKCASKLKIENQEFFEFSEQSIISNLYWGIESAEAAVEAKCEEDRIERVKSSERMLQVPALLNEHGVTAGIENAYLICCSYFYLSLVWRLQRDDWQAAIHFLQSLVVSPRIVFESFAQELCRYMFSLCVAPKRACRVDFEEDEVSEEMRRVAKRYKACLTYYRVMAYGETSQQQHGCSDFDSPEEKSQCFANMNSGSAESSNTDEREKSFRDYHNFEKVHPLDHRDDIAEEVMEFTEIQVFEERRKALTSLDKVSGKDVEKSSNIKCVQHLLKEYQSDTPISLDSRNSDFEEESSSEEYAYDYESSVRTIGMDADDPRPQISNKESASPLLQVKSTVYSIYAASSSTFNAQRSK